MITMRAFSTALLLSVLIGDVDAVEEVRVDNSRGVPQLVVDGQPMRARIFWGAPGSRPLHIGPEGQEITFEFTPTEDEPARATVHFRFGQSPGEIDLDDVRVESLDGQPDVVPRCQFEDGMADFERDWTYWPTGTQNTVGIIDVAAGKGHNGTGGLHIQLQSPPDGNWPDYHVYHHATLALKKGSRYRVRLWVRAKPARTLTIAFYRPGQVFTFLGGPPSCFESQIKLATRAGVDLVSFPVHLPWARPEEPIDWSVVDAQCRTVLEANPKALLLPRIGMGAPRWWQAAHPEAVMVWDMQAQQHVDVSVASKDYLRDAAANLKTLIEHLEDQFGPHMAGYHPCGQNTGEWFYQDTWGPALNGYSQASRESWREWLQRRYRTDQGLHDAWHDPSVRLQAAAVPSPDARRATPAGLLRDPSSEQSLIDFAEFQQEMMANCVCQLAQVVREASRGKRLVVFFYGYVFEFGAIRNGPATAGHYALRQVLQSPDIDVLCSPISYFDRGLAQSGPAMTAAESVTLAGKMWLVEDDTRTYLGSGAFPGWQDGVGTIEESVELLRRNTAQCALRNFGTWWMDLGAAGWFDDPRMWDEMKRLAALDEPLLRKPSPFRPDVALVIDERSMLRVAAGGDAVTRPGVYEVRRAAARMGTPYGQYLLDDVINGRVSARLYVFLDAWCLSPRERQELLRVTRGAARIWCYAPGYQEPNQVSMPAMRELTGFQLEKVSAQKARATLSERGRQLGLTTDFGTETSLDPLFHAVDAETSETLATYPDGTAAVAMRTGDAGTSIFVGPPGLTADLLRLAAQRAGVHLYTRSDCNIVANGPYLLLHAAADGPLEIDTGNSSPVRDLLTGENLGVGPDISLRLRKGESRVLVIAEEAGEH